MGWNKQTFERLIEATPEALIPRLRITHSMVLAEVEQGGDARARVSQLIADSIQTDAQKEELEATADEVFATLMDAGVVLCEPDEDGVDDYWVTIELPEWFALDQPLSPFLLAALELLDPESETYALDVISLVEATLEDPRQILVAQEKAARAKAVAEMKADGIEYEERMERLEEVTYEKPLEELIDAAFAQYCEQVPWARDYDPRPKSVLRDMLETASDFKGYVQKCGIARAEGILLRYLSEAYRALDRTVPFDKRDERLEDIIAWCNAVKWPDENRPAVPRTPTRWFTTAAPSPSWYATRSLHACVLLPRIATTSWASSTASGAGVLRAGSASWTNTLRRTRRSCSTETPDQQTTSRLTRATSVPTMCGTYARPSMAPRVTATLALPLTWISMPLRTRARSYLTTTASDSWKTC